MQLQTSELLDHDGKQVEMIPASQFQELEQELSSLIEEFVNSQDQMMALYELTQSMQSLLDMDDALQGLAKAACRIVKVRSASVILLEDGKPAAISDFPTDSREPAEIKRWYRQLSDGGDYVLWNREDGESSVYGDVVSIMMLPLQLDRKREAALILVDKLDGYFDSPDLKLAQSIAAQAGAQIEKIILVQESIKQAQLQTEMALARNVQIGLLPSSPPQMQGLDVWASSIPALEVGGDFYDFVKLADGSLVFSVGDVSGKGLAAALLMAMTRTTLRNAITFGASNTVEATLGDTNSALYDDFTEVGMFATLFVGQYHPIDRQVIYANAGHAPAIYCPNGGSARLLEADSVPIGVLPNSLAEDHALLLRPGDLLVVATDGLNEARDPSGKMFGYDRTLELVESVAELPARGITEHLLDTINTYVAGGSIGDDLTIIVLKGTAN